MMRTTGMLVGAGVAIAALGLTAAALHRAHGDQQPSPPSDGAGDSTGNDDITWSPDALLPDVPARGFDQSRFAAALFTQLDGLDDGVLEPADGGRVGAWGSEGATNLIDHLVTRYDTGGDGTLDRAEGAAIGADVAIKGRITPDAAARLYTDLTSE